MLKIPFCCCKQRATTKKCVCRSYANPVAASICFNTTERVPLATSSSCMPWFKYATEGISNVLPWQPSPSRLCRVNSQRFWPAWLLLVRTWIMWWNISNLPQYTVPSTQGSFCLHTGHIHTALCKGWNETTLFCVAISQLQNVQSLKKFFASFS